MPTEPNEQVPTPSEQSAERPPEAREQPLTPEQERERDIEHAKEQAKRGREELKNQTENPPPSEEEMNAADKAGATESTEKIDKEKMPWYVRTGESLMTVGVSIGESLMKIWQKAMDMWDSFQLRMVQNPMLRRFVNNPMLVKLGEMLDLTQTTIVTKGSDALHAGSTSIQEMFTIFRASVEGKGVTFEKFFEDAVANIKEKGATVAQADGKDGFSINDLVEAARDIRKKYDEQPAKAAPAEENSTTNEQSNGSEPAPETKTV